MKFTAPIVAALALLVSASEAQVRGGVRRLESASESTVSTETTTTSKLSSSGEYGRRGLEYSASTVPTSKSSKSTKLSTASSDEDDDDEPDRRTLLKEPRNLGTSSESDDNGSSGGCDKYNSCDYDSTNSYSDSNYCVWSGNSDFYLKCCDGGYYRNAMYWKTDNGKWNDEP